MLFDIDVKTRREDLFDRGSELVEFGEAVKLKEKLIVVYGIRRVGKSSLVNVALRVAGQPFVVVDVRKLYFESGLRAVSEKVLVEELVRVFNNYRGVLESLGVDLRGMFSRVKAVNVGGTGVEFIARYERPSLTEVLEEVDRWCVEHGKIFIIALDEAQYLRYSNRRYDLLLAWAADNLRNVVHVLTGSEVGLLRNFLKLEEADSPLRGRVRREIYVERFSKEEALEFLTRGFNEAGFIPPAGELTEAVESLDGVPGWLTLYGYFRTARGLRHEDALRLVFEEGVKMVISELENVVRPSQARYVAILKAVASGLNRWSDIKAFVETRTGPIPDNKFSELLNKLVMYGYLRKDYSRYIIIDPLVMRAVVKEM